MRIKHLEFFVVFMMAAQMRAAPSEKRHFVPTEDFARSALYSDVQMSPDGRTLAFIRELKDEPTLFFADLKTLHVQGLNLGTVPWLEMDQHVGSLQWISDRRVLFTTVLWGEYTAGAAAVDCDLNNFKPLTGVDSMTQRTIDPLYASEVIHAFDDADHSVLMLDQGEGYGSDIVFPNVVRVNTMTRNYHTVVKNPGFVVAWLADHDGVVRCGVTSRDGGFGLIYLATAEGQWRDIPKPPGHTEEILPLAFDPAGKKLYVSALSARHRWSVYLLDPMNGTLGDLVADDPDYDVVPLSTSRFYRRVYSPATHNLLGLNYVTDGPRSFWLSKEFGEDQAIIDQHLTKTVNRAVSIARDEKKLLFFSSSDRDPGAYYLLDVGGQSIRRLVARMPWLKPEDMAVMHPIQYPARDGTVIHGYLTLPVGAAPKNLPLVVQPHSGLWTRDVWSFDPFVQLLANRGYAVLQINYRGSPGYGDAFSELGRRQIGRGIQDDIEDGTRWAITHGIADPKRVAICGSYFGGYSALFALGHNPDLYRCGISVAGVSDWVSLFDRMADAEHQVTRAYWIKQMGDPTTTGDYLKTVSPVTFAGKMTAPLLIIQGNKDRTVPPKQAHLMIDALERAGHPPESLFIGSMEYGLNSEKVRTTAFKRIEEFLAKNLSGEKR